MPSAAASWSSPGMRSLTWAVSNFIVPVTVTRLGDTPSSTKRFAYV
jgi:hypothetical protein